MKQSLGYPIEGPFPCWVIDVEIGRHEDGRPDIASVAFFPDQAREIARRTVAHYKMTEEELA